MEQLPPDVEPVLSNGTAWARLKHLSTSTPDIDCTDLDGTAITPRREYTGARTEQLRADLVLLVQTAAEESLCDSIRITSAVEARYILATLLARARDAGFDGADDGLPSTSYDD